MPFFNQALFDQIIGATKTNAEITAVGGDYAAYVSTFVADVEAQEPQPINADVFLGSWFYYDRANVYYAWYKMSGYTNSTYLSRANAAAVSYRDYVLANPVGVQQHLQFVKCLALHYAVTGDASDLEAIRILADYDGLIWHNKLTVSPRWNNVLYAPPEPETITTGDERIIARTLEAYIVAHLCGVVSAYGYTWLTKANELLEPMLEAFDPDGGIRSATTSLTTAWLKPWWVKPFYAGQYCDALILYYDLITPDSRIAAPIQALGEYLFTATNTNDNHPLWEPGPNTNGSETWYNSFRYIEHWPTWEDAGPDAYGSPDLNGLVINIFAFTYARTGTAIWKTRAELLLNGMTYAPTAGKRLNQLYSYSYKAFPMLMGTTPPPTPTRIIRLRGV